MDIDFKKRLGFERAISISADETQLPENQASVIEQVRDFGIDEIYFCFDDQKSYPAIFLKKIVAFDEITLRSIAKIHRNTWNYKKILFLYVYNDTEIRIYNCVEKPFAITQNTNFEKELSKIEIEKAFLSDSQKLEKLDQLFSSISIDTGIIWTLDEAIYIKDKLKLQRRVDKYLVESLIKTTKQLEIDGLDDVGVVHKVMMRSLFLLYLEDRGATDAKFYDSIKPGAKNYFDILDDLDSTFHLFAELEKHFNGNVFHVSEGEKNKVEQKHLKLIKKCFINGYDDTDQLSLFENWRLFDFQIIQIELLSEIYENFLAAIDPKQKKQTGTFYTPPSLVELILSEKLPTKNSDTNYTVKVLDPACGSGIFLVESFKRLVKRYENFTGNKLTDFDTLKNILIQNIYGIEYSSQSIIVAAFSLYLALLDNLNPKTLWQDKKLPYLINDPENLPIDKQGSNLYRRDTIETNEEIERIEFDLVVGNPPFGTEKKPKVVLLDSIRNYCEENDFAKEMVLPFLHKAARFAPNGEIAMIFNTKILTNTGSNYQNFRKWLMQDCYMEKIYNFSILRNAPEDFGGQLFGSAMGPICIAFYQKNPPKQQSDRIIYYAPKTFVKSNMLEGVVIDSSDVKYLPREECQKPDTKIWKIAMWGGERDFNLIEKLSKSKCLLSYIKSKEMHKGLGLQFLDDSTQTIVTSTKIPETYIKPQRIGRYASYSFDTINIGISQKSLIKYATYYHVQLNKIPKIDAFRRIGKLEAYLSPHILIKEGLLDWNVCASFIDKECSFNSKVLGIHFHDKNILKGLTCFFNSTLVSYYLFLSSASIGIEREEIKPNEIDAIPFALSDANLYEMSKLYDKYIKEDVLENEYSPLEQEVDKMIFDIYGISSKEKNLISDFIDVSKPLMIKSYKSAFRSIQKVESENYLQTLCSEINEFLEGQTLFVTGTTYSVNKFSPLAMVKLSFVNGKQEIKTSKENLDAELKNLDKKLWAEKAGNIYFRKKMNYYDGNDIYIIRPNQRRFWTRTMAMEDASELILEILNGD